MSGSWRWTLLAWVALVMLGQPAHAQRDVTAFAAASLTNALQEITAAFTAETGIRVKLSFAASSTLAKQIEAGAAAHIFFSADEAWMGYLDKRRLIDASSRRSILGNRLAVVVPADRPVKLDIGLDRSWLAKLPSGRIATGDPAHVPVGRYAEQALRKLGVWADVAPRLARADNVRNALVLVERGEAAAGIVYATDAAASKKAVIAGLVPEDAHDPITYPIALTRAHGQGDARALLEFLTGPAARSTYARHGFAVR